MNSFFRHACRPKSVGFWIAIAVGIAAACASANKGHAATPFPDAGLARFSVEVTGQGPDVILIPGLGSSAATWDGTVAALKATHRVHVLNLAGFAGEPAGANAEGPVIAPSVEALDAYIKANQLVSPTVVGHSMGGLMALMLAQTHPEDTGRVVVADALPYVGLLFNPQATVAMMEPQAAAMRDGMVTQPDDAFRAQQTQSAAFLVSGASDQAKVLDWSMTSDRRVFARAFYDDMTIDIRPALPAMATPVTLIYPVAQGMDAGQTEQVYASAYAGTPHLTMVAIPRARHFEMLDQPEAFEKALEDALK